MWKLSVIKLDNRMLNFMCCYHYKVFIIFVIWTTKQWNNVIRRTAQIAYIFIAVLNSKGWERNTGEKKGNDTKMRKAQGKGRNLGAWGKGPILLTATNQIIIITTINAFNNAFTAWFADKRKLKDGFRPDKNCELVCILGRVEDIWRYWCKGVRVCIWHRPLDLDNT